MRPIKDWRCGACGETFEQYDAAVECCASVAPVFRCAACRRQYETEETAEMCCEPVDGGTPYVPSRERETRGQLCLL